MIGPLNSKPSLLILLVLLIVLFAIARKPRPIEDRFGSSLVAPSAWPKQTTILKVATYNVQTGKDTQGKRNITRASQVISDADIVGVQEVYADGWLSALGFGKAQTPALANRQFGYLFAPTRTRWLRDNRGNALLSKLPVSSWHIKALPDQSGKSFRNMTIAELVWQGESITLINTHLHTGRGREQQLDLVLEEFSKHSRAILLGDFNTTGEHSLIRNLLSENKVGDAINLANIAPHEEPRIDWILTKGFKTVDGMWLAKGVSDHPYYQVSLMLDDESTN